MGIEIDLERDSLLEEVSRKRLRESYMKEEEQSPQERFATVAETFASNPAHAQRIYDYASKHWLSFSTLSFLSAEARKDSLSAALKFICKTQLRVSLIHFPKSTGSPCSEAVSAFM